MAHGAGLFIGFFVVWACATLAGGWPPAITLGLGAFASILVVAMAGRMGGLDREGARHFTRAVAVFTLSVSRWPSSFLSALGVVATVVGVRRARAGYVRLKLSPHDGVGLAAVVEALSATPNLLAVDADAGSILAHALNEDAVDVARLKSLERRAAGDERGTTAS